MEKKITNRNEDEETLIDIDTGEEIVLEDEEVSNTSLKSKLKKIINELKEAKKERDDNLAGWQRAKADLVNLRKKSNEEKEIKALRAKAEIVRAILPALDTFDTAMKDSSWKTVDKNWREGIERIESQLKNTLKSEGVEIFGEKEEDFNPEIHECMSVVKTDKKEKDDKISEVLQKGYRFGKELIRPAKVIIFQFDKNTDK